MGINPLAGERPWLGIECCNAVSPCRNRVFSHEQHGIMIQMNLLLFNLFSLCICVSTTTDIICDTRTCFSDAD